MRPHGLRRFAALSVNRTFVYILDRNALLNVPWIAVRFEQDAAIGKDDLPVGKNITEIVQPLGVPIHIFNQREKISRKIFKQNLSRYRHPAMRYNHQNIRTGHCVYLPNIE